MSLVLTPLRGFPLVAPGDDLGRLVFESVLANSLQLADGDILVLAQKVVSKSEGRLVDLNTVVPGKRALRLAQEADKDPRFVELVLAESREVLRVRPGTLIVEHRCGFICANAGIDHSNVAGPGGDPADWVLLLPQDPDASAERLRASLEARSSARLGVLVIDSHGRAWRNGTVGVAIGISAVPGLVDLRGTPDLFGYQLKITQVGTADELAAAASLVMGQAAEGTPVVHVRGFPYPLRDSSLDELLRPRDMDLFR